MNRWLFSRRLDLALFGGTAVIALVLAALAGRLAPTGEPEWTWITGVLLVDVAHVWSTAFVVYLDPAEWQRRRVVYAVVPLACFGGGVILFALGGEALFWRIVAYLAVFHFIRQQYGWVMLYRARNGEHDRLGRWLDGATIYAATLYPLIVWHTRLPREFWWMREHDFIAGAPEVLATIAGWIYLALLVLYVVRALTTRPVWGKHVIVATTAACWYVGIVATNSDYTFTVTNVFIHGVPYLALVYLYARAASREAISAGGAGAALLGRTPGQVRGLVGFLATLWVIAYLEELLWDRTTWHDREWLFGGSLEVGGLGLLIVPLLATPQLTHYVLDAFLWRRRSNPRLARLL